MFVTPSGIVTDVILLQPKNADDPILVTPVGIVNDVALMSKVYQTALEEVGIEPVIADTETQKLVMSVIYDYVKAVIAVSASTISESIYRSPSFKSLLTIDSSVQPRIIQSQFFAVIASSICCHCSRVTSLPALT